MLVEIFYTSSRKSFTVRLNNLIIGEKKNGTGLAVLIILSFERLDNMFMLNEYG